MQSIQERNEQNAKSSTGPRTPQGKARSSQNALKFGMYAKSTLLPDEDIAEYNDFCSHIELDLKPENSIQDHCVRTICDHIWRLQRCRRLEASCFERMNEIVRNYAKDAHESDLALACAWEWDCENSHSIEKLSKHQTRISNALDRAMKEFRLLKSELFNQRYAEKLQAKQNKARIAQTGFVPRPPESVASPTAQNTETTPPQPPDKV